MALQVAKVQEFKGHTQAIYSICVVHNANFFYSASADCKIVIWNIINGEGSLFAQLPNPIYSIFYSNNRLYAGSNKGILYVFDCLNKKLIKEINLTCGGIFSIVNINNSIIFGAENGNIYFYENNEITSVKISTKSIRKILVDAENLILASSDFNIYKYNIQSRAIDTTLSAHTNSVFAVEKHKNTILSGGRDAQLLVWKNHVLEHQINAHLLHINDIQINAEANIIATCSMDKTIKIWNADTFQLLKVINHEKHLAHTSSVNKILWIDKNTLISCSDDRNNLQFNIQ